VKVRKHCGDKLKFGHRNTGTDGARHRTARRTKVALVGSAAVIIETAADVTMVSALVLSKDFVMMVLMPSGRHVMAVRMLGQLRLGLNAEASNRAQHASG
jgi:hypothetical protein